MRELYHWHTIEQNRQYHCFLINASRCLCDRGKNSEDLGCSDKIQARRMKNTSKQCAACRKAALMVELAQ